MAPRLAIAPAETVGGPWQETCFKEGAARKSS